jgi:hypothetical protein
MEAVILIGFDALYYVRIGEDGRFVAERWLDEV